MHHWNRALVVSFVVLIALPGVATLLGVRGVDADENRTPAPPPVVRADWASLRALPDAFTRYFEDNFAFRARLVRTQADLRLRAFGVSPSPAVVVARDGWLFYGEDGAIEDYAVAPPMSPADLEEWRRTLQQTQDWLAVRGIAYAFVIAPDKHVIYPEMMVKTVTRFSERSRIDQLVDYLRQWSTVRVIDLRPALVSAKTRERIYHRTDTHWNDRGAHVAYEQILRGLAMRGVEPLPRPRFRAEARPAPGLDLAGMMGLTGQMSEEDLVLVPLAPRRARVVEPADPKPHGIYARLVTEHPDRSLPRAVIYRDSFTSALIPFLSEHFSRALYLWERDLDPAVIEQEQPQVVIQQWVGRRLGPYLPYNPFQQ